MKIENRQKLLSILAIAVVAIWAGDKLVISPLWANWNKLSERKTELVKLISKGTLLVERGPSIRNRWSSMETNTLPAETSVAENEVLKAFERWSRHSGMSITSIKPQWKRNADDYMTLECRADAFGSARGLAQFVYDVENDPLALKVEIVEISSRDNDGQQLLLGLQVSGLLLHPPAQ